MKKQKWVVWSFDASEWQTFQDIVLASSAGAATRRVQRARPYATMDAYVEPMLLADHIAALSRELASHDDGFKMIEDDAKVRPC